MKQTTALALLIPFCIGQALHAQIKKGTWELSLSGTGGTVSSSTESRGPTHNSSSDNDAEGFLSVALRPAYYVAEGLALEPEILLTTIGEMGTGYSISGNIAYNFSVASNVAPFVLGGYGIGNSIPLFRAFAPRVSENSNISVLNLGAGLKIFLTHDVALRTEYRYQRYSQERSFGDFAFRIVNNFHNVFFGFSVL